MRVLGLALSQVGVTPGSLDVRPVVNCTACFVTLVINGGAAPAATVWVTKAGAIYLPLNKTAPAILPPFESLPGIPNIASYRTGFNWPRVTAFDAVRLVIDPLSGAVAIDTLDVAYTPHTAL